MLAVIWVLLMERNRRTFEVCEGVGVEELWERVSFGWLFELRFLRLLKINSSLVF